MIGKIILFPKKLSVDLSFDLYDPWSSLDEFDDLIMSFPLLQVILKSQIDQMWKFLMKNLWLYFSHTLVFKKLSGFVTVYEIDPNCQESINFFVF